MHALCQMTIFRVGADDVCKFDRLQVVDVTRNTKRGTQTTGRDLTIAKERKISSSPQKFGSVFEPSSSVSGVGDDSCVLKQERFNRAQRRRSRFFVVREDDVSVVGQEFFFQLENKIIIQLSAIQT